MALDPLDPNHALQIQSGILGRRRGHKFEEDLAIHLNELDVPFESSILLEGNVFRGDPASLLLRYVMQRVSIDEISSITAISTGALATSEEGKTWLYINGSDVSRCKSDIVLTLEDSSGEKTIGVSIKQCNACKPTNAQLYFTTAIGFTSLLRSNGVDVSDVALYALRQFCGDVGFRPADDESALTDRVIDPRRWFWEEIETEGRQEWEALFSASQDKITKLLFTKGYDNDPFAPEYILHKTKRADSWSEVEVAIYSIDELVTQSANYGGFSTRSYSVRKGSYRDPAGVSHQAPRFGIVQMQRGGQAQHPTQLQFNLQAGYFYKLAD